MPADEQPVEIGSVKISPELDFKQHVANASNYKYIKRLQQQGGESVTLQLTSSSTSLFELPADVLNLSRSRLTFSMLIPTPGAAVRATKMRLDYPPIRALHLKTATGKQLVEIPNFPEYWMMVKDHCCKAEKQDGPPGIGADIATAKLAGLCTFNNSAHQYVAGAGPTMVAETPCIGKVDSAGAIFLSPFLSNAHSGCQIVGGADTATMGLHCSLELGKIFHTILSADKNIYFPESLRLEIEWIEARKIMFGGTVLTDLTGAFDFPTATPISELALYVAVEQNRHNHDLIKTKVESSGLSMVVPYVHMVSNSIGAATSASVQARINAGFGSSLLRVYTAERLTSEANNLVKNFHNVAGALTTNFYHQLDSQRVEDVSIDEESGQGYIMQQNLNQGSLVQKKGLVEYYATCPAYCVDWSSCSKLVDAPIADLDMAGLPLNKEYLFTKVITKPAADTVSFFCIVTQKNLLVDARGIFIN